MRKKFLILVAQLRKKILIQKSPKLKKITDITGLVITTNFNKKSYKI